MEKNLAVGDPLCKLRTPNILTFFEDPVDRKTQQRTLKEKRHQPPCGLPAKARGPQAS